LHESYQPITGLLSESIILTDFKMLLLVLAADLRVIVFDFLIYSKVNTLTCRWEIFTTYRQLVLNDFLIECDYPGSTFRILAVVENKQKILRNSGIFIFG